VREVVARFQPRVTGAIQIRPKSRGVKQEPPLKVLVEAMPEAGLAERIVSEVRASLVFTPAIEIVPPQSLPRSEYKSRLVDFSEAV
jgi:phenylacetate-CoA ligase